MPVVLHYDFNDPGFTFNPATDEGFLMSARYWGRTNDDMPEESRTQVARTTYTGCVLAKQEENYGDDSDFYAIVWDRDKQEITRVQIGSTRYAGGGKAEVDATANDIEAARLWLTDWHYNRLKECAERDAREPQVKKYVKSLIKTGKKAGIEGIVKWRGPNKFRTYYRNGYNQPDDLTNQVVGIKVEGQEKLVYIDLLKVDVINYAKYLPSDEDLYRKAMYKARHGSWAEPFWK